MTDLLFLVLLVLAGCIVFFLGLLVGAFFFTVEDA